MQGSGAVHVRQLGRVLSRVLMVALVGAVMLGAAAGVAEAYTESDRTEQRRYARETVEMTYTQFLARKADFERAKCRVEDHLYIGTPTPGCGKPSPYDAFDWTDDGCSGRNEAYGIGFAVSNTYRDLFNGPCQQHDFGYRNLGTSLQLDRSEDTRAWIDGRFLAEMNRLCDTTRSGAGRLTCRATARTVWTVVRNGSDWSGPAPTAVAPLDRPAPLAAPTPAAPVFPVMNTSEQPPDGVWFRNSARTADTDRVTGHGVYRGDQVRLTCHAWGEAVGVHANRLWYRVANLTRPAVGARPNEGFLNAHYVDDGLVANQVAAGVPAC